MGQSEQSHTWESGVAEVGDIIEAANAAWSFGGNVSENFDEHVNRSVPMYQQGHALVTALSDFFLADGSVCYDLGCSTGALCERLARHHAHRDLRIVGIDAQPSMIDKARERCTDLGTVQLQCEDALTCELEPCDLIVCYYTLQFVRPQQRQALFDRLYDALNWGGGLVMFEKVRAPDARFQDMMSTLYSDYKLSQGYTGEQIVAKTRSLKGVLEPFSTQGNLGLLQRAGFTDIMTVMKYLCFEGFLAIK